MKTIERYKGVIEWFTENMPEARSELNFRNTYELLVAVILSAQCTDKRVNMVTPKFFEAFPSSAELAGASVEQIFELIRSISYPNAKAENLLQAARRMQQEFGGEVPGTVEELETLRGVGRKTANVIVSVAFDTPAMAVDTHVFRVSERIGLTTRARNPLQAEQQLVRYFPREVLSRAHHWLILHGRYVCLARKPRCSDCGISEWCRYNQRINSRQKPTI